MSELKTTPKTREKPTAATHAVKNAPKTAKSVPYNVLRNAPSVMKEQLVKQTSEKLSKIQQDGQTAQTPENYATDSVENAAYSTAARVYRTTRTIAEHKIKSHKARKIETKEVYTIQETAPSPDVPEIKRKSIPQAKAKAQQKAEIKTKENYIKNHSVETDVKTPDTVRRDYVKNKLKEKSEEQKRLQITDTEIPKTAKADVIPDKSDIKTKESYMQSLRNDKAEPIKSAYRTPKQKQSNISRQIQTTSKAVHTKQKMTSDTVKNSRNVFKASRTAKKKASKAQKAAVKTQKQVTKQAAKKTAKMAKEAAQRSAQAAKAATRAAIKVAVKVVQAVVAAAQAIISAIASGGAVAIVVVVLIIIIIIAAVVASPFGIFVSEEVTDIGTIPLSQIIAEYNVELTQEVEDIELSVDHTDVEVIDNQTDSNVVLAVFAAKTAGSEDSTAEDVVIFDDVKAEKLKAYFRAANTVNYTVDEIAVSDTETKKKLTVTISGKTKDELMDLYSLTAKQREAALTLLENGDVLTSSSHSLAITNADVQSIIQGLPASLPQKRKDVVKNAGSLVGKVNYFWGGKSSAIGWDSAWGTMRRVTAAGSPSSGTLRAYGLDCSGFVTWAFNNSGMYVGDGTYGQRDRSVQVTASTVQAGDLCFLPSYSHVGIVVGKDTGGNILVIHCSSGANNVVVSTASSVGFTVFRRPNCY